MNNVLFVIYRFKRKNAPFTLMVNGNAHLTFIVSKNCPFFLMVGKTLLLHRWSVKMSPVLWCPMECNL